MRRGKRNAMNSDVEVRIKGRTATSVKEFLTHYTAMARGIAHPWQEINGYCCMEEFVLKNGREFTYQPRPKGVKLGTPQECYKNAARLAMRNELLTYVEGYAFGVFPVMHAWCVNKDGIVIENTWEEGEGYFGVPIKTKYLMHSIYKSQYYGVIDRCESRWPILREKPENYLAEMPIPKL